MRYFILLTALIGLTVYANLPPTQLKGGNESKLSTTFNFNLGQIPVTRTGTSVLFGTIPVTQGGTSSTSLTQYSLMSGNGTSAVNMIAPAASGTILFSNGASAYPSYRLLASNDVTTALGYIPLASSTAAIVSTLGYTPLASSSAAIISTLGYTPANQVDLLAVSATTNTNTLAIASVSSTVNTLSGTVLRKANNLSDVASATVARTNLGLGSVAVENIVPISKGGTGLSTIGSSNTVLTSDGVNSSWSTAVLAAKVFAPMTTQSFVVSGTYNINNVFVINTGSASQGAVYRNNGINFTVNKNALSSTQVVLSGSGTATSSGTLTKVSGNGDSTLTFSQYMRPLYIIVDIAGGGGGGSYASNPASVVAGSGSNSTFGGSLITAGGGGGSPGGVSTDSSSAGAGGTFSTSGDVVVIESYVGGTGQGGPIGSTCCAFSGGQGGTNYRGGAGAGGRGGNSTASNSVGGAGVDCTGAGGGGAGLYAAGVSAGAGGGAGGAGKVMIYSPGVSYSVVVGNGGGAGISGGGGANGGAGAKGCVYINEYYQ